jgi:hypothetical protein
MMTAAAAADPSTMGVERRAILYSFYSTLSTSDIYAGFMNQLPQMASNHFCQPQEEQTPPRKFATTATRRTG